jgi:hypothetical protein
MNTNTLLEETNNLTDLSNINIISLKRSFNILSRKAILEETDTLLEIERELILKYNNHKELYGFYKLSESKFSSFKDMILSSF